MTGSRADRHPFHSKITGIFSSFPIYMKTGSSRLLNAPWLRALLFCVFFTVLLMAFSFLKTFLPASYERWAHGILGLLAAGITSWIFIRVDRGSSFQKAGLLPDKGSPRRFLAGLLMGILLMGLLTAGVILAAGFRVTMNPGSGILHFLLITLPLIPLAAMEETGFRGYPYQQLEKGYGAIPAIMISAFLFGAYHLANGWSVQDAFLGAGVWGLVFGLARAWSGGIALPTGLHYGANLTTSAFGVPGSGSALFLLNSPGKEPYVSSQWEILLPQLALLLLGITAMVWYSRILARRRVG